MLSTVPLRWGLLSTALLLSLSAQAQVVRCTDARTGKVTYTDGSCAPGSQTREIEARKTPEELRAEREQATEALARKEQRLQNQNSQPSKRSMAIQSRYELQTLTATSNGCASTPKTEKARQYPQFIGTTWT